MHLVRLKQNANKADLKYFAMVFESVGDGPEFVSKVFMMENRIICKVWHFVAFISVSGQNQILHS